MTESIMLINETDDECRIAVIENGILQEMLIEHTHEGQTKNNIYKGVVVQVQTSLQAAFVDYGDKKHGFLPNSELNPVLFKGKKQRKSEPIQHKISVGDSVFVQVTREASNNKGAALSTYITLPGRFMVLMPYSDKGGVSKKIDNAEERDRLKSFLSGIESEEHAVIIRTAGLGRSLSELKKDYTALKKTWNEIWSKYETMEKSGLVLAESDVVTRTLRDYYTEEIVEVWVDNPETFQNALAFFKEVAPRKQKDLKLFVDDRSLFATYHIERQVEQLTSKQIKLKSGGSIVIDQTEALVAIDVNSGRSNQEGNIDSTALRTNLEAAEEISRQLRLRNLGGLIVIDFIDMENESFRKQVEEKLSEAMKKDKAQLRFNPISQFGLLELSRQRLAVGISSTVESTCPVCNGKGKIPSILASTNLIIRSIRELAVKGNVTRIEGDLPLELVNVLLNDRRQSISDLELEFDIDIVLRGNPEMAVFNERFLKPVYKRRHKHTNEGPQKKESVKAEFNKKRPKKQPAKKDSGEQNQKAIQPESKQKKEEPTVQPESKPRKEEPTSDDKQENYSEPVKAVKKTEKKPSRQKAQKSAGKKGASANDKENVGNFGIHPSCLFTDVRELEENELEEVTASFENRLKGKIDNAPSQFIDDKYLWKSQNGKGKEGPSSENEQETEDASDSGDDFSQDEGASPKAKKTNKRRSTKKPSARSVEKQVKEKDEDVSDKKASKPSSNAKEKHSKSEESKPAKAKSKKTTRAATTKSKSSSAAKKVKEADSEAKDKKQEETKKPAKKSTPAKKTTPKKATTKKKEDAGKAKLAPADKSEKSPEKKPTAAKKTTRSTKANVSKAAKAKKTSKEETVEKSSNKSAAKKKPVAKAKKS